MRSPAAHIALLVFLVLASTALNIWGTYARIRPASQALIRAQAAKQNEGPAREHLRAVQHDQLTRGIGIELVTLAIAVATFLSIRRRMNEPPI